MDLHLSLPPTAAITVKQNGLPVRKTLNELLGNSYGTYDWFGNTKTITVTDSGVEENLYILATPSGELFHVGETHSVFCRKPNEGRWTRTPISEIESVVYVRLPQRKSRAPSGLFDILELDDDGLYLAPEKASKMLSAMEKAAFMGTSVNRSPNELRIDIDRRRPACFASKLITGSFEHDLAATLDGLVGNGVIQPCQMFNDDYIELVNDCGTVFEGYTVYNDIPLVRPRRVEKKLPVYHITVEQDAPVELTWCHS